MTQKFIQVRGSGDVFYYTPELAKREDVDVFEGGDDDTPETVLATLAQFRAELEQRRADEAAALAKAAQEKATAAKKAASSHKVPAGVTVAPPPPAPQGSEQQ